MLKQLAIDNFAIIEHIKLDFQPGLTVITGETGAGKSILIDAISLLLGDRASQEMIRSGADRANVSGLFAYSHEQIPSLLRQWGIPFQGQEIAIEREITLQNKNVIRVNQQVISLQQLKSLAVLIADIHSQFDTQRLINPQTYLELLDGYQPQLIRDYLDHYQTLLARFRESNHHYQTLVQKKAKMDAERDRLSEQYRDLDASHLDPEEMDRLSSEAKIMENYDKVYDHLSQVKSLFSDERLLENIYQIRSHIDCLQPLSADYVQLHEKISDHYYELDDIRGQIDDLCRELNYDPMRLDQIHERLFHLSRIQEKYQLSIAECCQLRDDLKELLQENDHVDEQIRIALEQTEELFSKTIESGQMLSRVRREVAQRIESELKQLLAELALPNTNFAIRFDSRTPQDLSQESAFLPSGLDQIDFFLSTNIGEPLKPLAKTASGGEMGRIMLGLKTLFIRQQQLSTMVFDEIDTGISGKVARQIGRKLLDIASACQVLSITHIPQVVAKGNHHLHVEKVEIAGRTLARARYLDFDDRVTEIARMISDSLPSPAAIQSAKELLMSP
jgi:DNA repair protein RecN (Recombination protein N)